VPSIERSVVLAGSDLATLAKCVVLAECVGASCWSSAVGMCVVVKGNVLPRVVVPWWALGDGKPVEVGGWPLVVQVRVARRVARDVLESEGGM
jgi:hypothetical protein